MQLAAARTSPAVVALPQNAAAPRCRCSGRPSTSHRRSVCTAAAAGQPSSSSSSHHSSTQDAIRETVISTRRSALLTAGLLCVAGNSQGVGCDCCLQLADGCACRTPRAAGARVWPTQCGRGPRARARVSAEGDACTATTIGSRTMHAVTARLSRARHTHTCTLGWHPRPTRRLLMFAAACTRAHTPPRQPRPSAPTSTLRRPATRAGR
jgi:hypothetical protein